PITRSAKLFPLPEPGEAEAAQDAPLSSIKVFTMLHGNGNLAIYRKVLSCILEMTRIRYKIAIAIL
ncbi:MAG TPA: hypothetical protein VHF05_03150, partial [Candidatus Paceibacterota bacterium]|nr:hypothetical protein [Candidatus Paceibacterota bacterium]